MLLDIQKETRVEMISDMVYFKYKYITLQKVPKADLVIQAAKKLTKAITKHVPTAQPVTNFESLQKSSKIFDEVAKEKVSVEQ